MIGLPHGGRVDDPSGQTWRVKRRWLPWRLRKRDPDIATDLADGFDVHDLLVGLVVFVLVLIIVIVAPWLIVGAVLAFELILLLVLLPLFVLLRVLRVGRWPLEVWHLGERDRLVHSEVVRGWRASRGRLIALHDEIFRATPDQWMPENPAD